MQTTQHETPNNPNIFLSSRMDTQRIGSSG
jgi:hypothetical protein